MAIVAVLLFTLSITLIVFIEVKKYFVNKQLHGFKPIKGIIPILGAILRTFGTTRTTILDEIFKVFDETKSMSVRFWAGWILAIGTYDPGDVEILLTNEDCLNKPYMYEQFYVNTSLLVVDRESWKIKRRAMNSAFSKMAMQRYLPTVNEHIRELTKQFDANVNQRCDVYREIFIGMMDTVSRTLMGVNKHIEPGRSELYYPLMKQIMNSITYRVVRFWLRFDFIFYNLSSVGRAIRQPLKMCNDLIDEVYRERINEIDKMQQENPNVDYLDEVNQNGSNNVLERCLLLERDGIFDYENTADHMRVIIVAGIDTSAITIFSSLLLLAMNQKHQDLVVDELRTIFKTADCDVTQEHLAEMKYTERVIKESMRLISPIPGIVRQLSADVKLPNGTLPKGTIVGISMMHMHRNPKVWGENALEFDPDRFLPENVEKRPPFSYIPFSAGPRNCIGIKFGMQTAKVTLAYLLRKYKFTTDLKFNEIKLSSHLIMEIENDKPLRFERRTF